MKWFKHISDSLDDPFIFNLIEKHDANGYLVFFGVLEVYAREFKTELGWKLHITLPYLRKKMNRTRNKLITNVLETLKEAGKWEIRIDGDDVCIYIPKFRELLDETTLKKLRESEKPSGIVPESFLQNSVQTKTKTKTEIKAETPDGPFQLPSKEEITEASEIKVKEDVEKVAKQLYEEKIFPKVHAFKNLALKQNKNLRSILHTLTRCYISKPEEPWGYCLKTIGLEHLNYNERDYQKTAR